jgi:hypothetical protein
MSPSRQRVLSGFIGAIMMIAFVGGVLLFHDGPIGPCSPNIPYLYSNHPFGYCGKQGQSHTAADYHRFLVWEAAMLILWPLGMAALFALRGDKFRNKP